MAEQLIKDNFGSWTVPGKGAPLPDFGEPDPSAPATRVTVEPGAPTGLTMAWLRPWRPRADTIVYRSEEHTSELQSLMRISYAVFCLQKKKRLTQITVTDKSADQHDNNNTTKYKINTN